MIRRYRHIRPVVGVLLLLAACAPQPAPAPQAPPPAPPPPPPPPPPEVVWTARPEVPLHTDSGTVAIALTFSRLEISGRAEDGLYAYCEQCPGGPRGVVLEDDVVAAPTTPVDAATGSAAEFALALRHAAAWGKVDSLAPVMVSDFTFGFSAQRDRAAALTAWGWENYRTLDQLPAVLDRGLTEIAGGLWVAPPEYAAAPNHTGVRTGFRRNSDTGRWEWLFLVGSEQ